MERQKLCEASQQESASHDTQEDIFPEFEIDICRKSTWIHASSEE